MVAVAKASIWLKTANSDQVVDTFQSHLECKITETIRVAIEDIGESSCE